jgi:hypothetical protein
MVEDQACIHSAYHPSLRSWSRCSILIDGLTGSNLEAKSYLDSFPK